jgi:hypothetical protein
MLLVQLSKNKTEEPISLHWKTEYDDGVIYASSDDNIIIPDLTIAASDNEEAISNVAEQEELVDEVKGITDDWTHSENLENSTEVISSSAKVLRESRSYKKPPITRKEDIFMVEDNQRVCINPLIIFHQNICGLRKN